jgi:peptidoglycan glycosyltransferase
VNLRILFLALTGLTLLTLAGVEFGRLMLGPRRGVLSQPFSNSSIAATMESLLAKGIITSDNGAVAVDQAQLEREVPAGRTRAQVRELMPFVQPDADGRLSLDRRAVEVRYRPPSLDGPRGTIWDRDGDVLARSVKEARSQRSRRDYPLGSAAFHIVGASHPAFGDRGIEAAYRNDLAPGHGLTLSLSARVQRAAAEALGDRAGAAVVMEVPSGELLGVVSSPSFDPNQRTSSAWLAAERDRDRRPLANRAVGALYPPGSAFKVVDLAAWLEAPEGDAGMSMHCTGHSTAYRIRDQHAHGPVGIESAFARSCNIFFAEVGVRLGPRLQAAAERFGFNAPIPLADDAHPALIAVASQAFAWRRGDQLQSYLPVDFRRNPKVVAQSAIGQNLVVATPLQMALVAATVASDGRRPQPVLVRSAGTGPDRAGRARGGGVPVVRPETARAMATMMTGVMTDGTGKRLPRLYRFDGGVRVGAVVPSGATPIAVAAKTGTAEVGATPGAQRPHAWFIAFAPAERPQVALAVVVEHGGSGAESAGPVALTVLAAALESLARPPIIAAGQP